MPKEKLLWRQDGCRWVGMGPLLSMTLGQMPQPSHRAVPCSLLPSFTPFLSPCLADLSPPPYKVHLHVPLPVLFSCSHVLQLCWRAIGTPGSVRLAGSPVILVPSERRILLDFLLGEGSLREALCFSLMKLLG